MKQENNGKNIIVGGLKHIGMEIVSENCGI
jgi:hypothetical protein